MRYDRDADVRDEPEGAHEPNLFLVAAGRRRDHFVGDERDKSRRAGTNDGHRARRRRAVVVSFKGSSEFDFLRICVRNGRYRFLNLVGDVVMPVRARDRGTEFAQSRP